MKATNIAMLCAALALSAGCSSAPVKTELLPYKAVVSEPAYSEDSNNLPRSRLYTPGYIYGVEHPDFPLIPKK